MKESNAASKITELLLRQDFTSVAAYMDDGFCAVTLELEKFVAIRDAWIARVPQDISLMGIAGIKRGNSARVNYVLEFLNPKNGILDIEVNFSIDKKAPSLEAVWSFSVWSEVELAKFEGLSFDAGIAERSVRWLT